MVREVCFRLYEKTIRALGKRMETPLTVLAANGIKVSGVHAPEEHEAGVDEREGVMYITDQAHVFAALQKQGCYVLPYLHENNRGESFAGALYAVENLEEMDEESFDLAYRRLAGLPWEIITTEHCAVRETTVEDVDSFYQIYKEPSITEYMENLFADREEEIAYTRDYIEKVYAFYGYGMWTVLEKESGVVIGRAGITWREGYDLPELGFVFGVPGSGKSFFCKMEMGNVFLSGNDEIIVIDPMNEYFDIAQTYGGTVVNMSTYTDNYVNPLDMDVWSLDLNDSKGMIREKGEFMLGLCEQCMGESLNSRQKSIIDRCVRKLYIEIARNREKYVPIMSDFYEILMNQPEDEARDIALSLELFVNGSLNIFNHQTNVDVDNRFTVYGIRDLGTELSPITMLVMMESIQNRIIANGKRGIATWLYIDEFHVLLNSEYSAKYLQQLWKKVRKQGGLCTGITQNIVDLLQNYTATTMLANSEFVALLKQANTDSSRMAEVIGVSEAQLRFVTNTSSGMGLMKCGNVVIPFDNTIEKGTDLYNLYNTNIHEKIQMQKMVEKGQESS